MSNWDDDDWEDSAAAPAPVNRHPLAASEGLGDWDDEDAESEPEPEVKKAPAPMKPSKARAKALKEKEEAERQAEIERVMQREKELKELSAVERKIRQQQIVEEADLENARELFMEGTGAGVDAGDGKSAKDDDEPTIESFKPVTDADHARFAKMLSDRVAVLNTNPKRATRYVEFMKTFLRGATADLGPEDTRDLSTFLGLISNEKRDEQKKARGVKKKNRTKTSVRVDKASDIRSDKYDDFADDFM